MAKKQVTENEPKEVKDVKEEKPTYEELEEQVNALVLQNSNLLLQQNNFQKKIDRIDGMFGIFKEKHSEAFAQNVWYSLEVQDLKEQLAAAKERIQQLESGTE